MNYITHPPTCCYKMLSSILYIDFNAVSEGNVEAILDAFCGSDHVIPKHEVEW